MPRIKHGINDRFLQAWGKNLPALHRKILMKCAFCAFAYFLFDTFLCHNIYIGSLSLFYCGKMHIT